MNRGTRNRAFLIGIGGLVTTACFDGGITGSSTVNGAYTLRTLNGSPLPVTVSGSGANKTEIVDDVITLYQGSTYAETEHTRVTVNSQATLQTNSESGSYALLGTSVSLSSSTGRSRIASVEANTMTIIESGRTWVYSK